MIFFIPNFSAVFIKSLSKSELETSASFVSYLSLKCVLKIGCISNNLSKESIIFSRPYFLEIEI